MAKDPRTCTHPGSIMLEQGAALVRWCTECGAELSRSYQRLGKK